MRYVPLIILFGLNICFSKSCTYETFKNTQLKFSIDEVGDFSLMQHVNGCVTPAIISPKVQIIECYDQSIPLVGEGAISDMLSLQTLVFRNNKINKIKFAAFLNLPNLEDIVLVNNSIRIIEVGVFGLLPSVSRVDLYNNKITFFEHGTFTNMPKLLFLIAGKNELDTIEHQWFDIDSTLSTLDLSHNLIRRVPFDAFKNTKKLERINLSNNKILTIGENAFSGLTTLFMLDLSNNRIYQLTGRLFLPLVKLYELNLNGNNLTYIHNQILKDVTTTLGIMTVYSNPWQCACYDNIHRWARSRPKMDMDVIVGCKVTFNPVCVIPINNPDKCLEDPDEELDYMFYQQFNTANTCKA